MWMTEWPRQLWSQASGDTSKGQLPINTLCPGVSPEIHVLYQRAVKYYERDTWSLWSWRCSQFTYPYYRDSNILLVFFKWRTEKHRSWDFSEGVSPRFAPCRLAKIMRWTEHMCSFPHSSVHLPLGWHSTIFSIGPSSGFGQALMVISGKGLDQGDLRSQLPLKIKKAGLWDPWSHPQRAHCSGTWG